MVAEILSVMGLSAGYDRKVIVAGVDLDLQAGDVLGLLGANGSGKSTLLKAISGQIQPFAGKVTIAGLSLQAAPELAKARFGYAVDGADLPLNLTGRQYLELVASIRHCKPLHWACGDVIGRLALAAWLDLPIRQYSMGTRAKISIAASMLGLPKLLMFDESLNGLDPLAAWETKQMIVELAKTGHAVIVSTHVVEAVPALCNRALFLAGGKIVKAWDKDALQRDAGWPGAFEANVIQALKTFTAKSRLAA